MLHAILKSGGIPAEDLADTALLLRFASAAITYITKDQLIDFRRRVGQNGHKLTWDRVRALNLSLKDGVIVDDKDRILVPVEAFGVIIDLVALNVFASPSRDRLRVINIDAVLTELAVNYVAGGKSFGAIRQRDVTARLERKTLPIDDGLPLEPIPSMSALLRRIQRDYDALLSEMPDIAKLLPPGMHPHPDPLTISNFATGLTRCILVPADVRMLLALPHVFSGNSGLSYVRVIVSVDGLEIVYYRCPRNGPSPPGPAAGSANSSDADDDSVGSGSGSDCISSDSDGGKSAGDMTSDLEDDAAKSDADGVAGILEPPHLTRDFFVDAGLKIHDSRTAIALTPYGVFCGVELRVCKPPNNGEDGASWLLVRSVDEDKRVLNHTHDPNEYLPMHPALENTIRSAMQADGHFRMRSHAISMWLKDVERAESAAFKAFAATAFRTWNMFKPPTLHADGGVLATPTGDARRRGGAFLDTRCALMYSRAATRPHSAL